MARKRPMKIEDLFRLRAVGRVAISPDGRRLVYELKRHDPDENKNFVQLLVIDVDSGDEGDLTAAAQHSDTMPAFSPDGKSLAFISTRNKAAQLFVMPLTGGEPRALTDRDGNVSDLAWSPDGKRIACIYQAMSEREQMERDEKQDALKKRPQFKHITRLTHKLDGAGFWNGNYKHVHVVEVNSGRTKQLTGGDYDHVEPRFAPDGRQVSFVSNRTENPDVNFDQTDIYCVSVKGGKAKRITQGPGAAGGHTWSPDGRTIAYIGAPNKPGEWWKFDEHVWLVPASGGRPRELTRDIDNVCTNATLGDVAGNPFELAAPIWSPDGSRLYFLVSEHGACRLYSRSIKRKDTRCEIGGDVSVYCMQYAAEHGRFALALGSATNPGDVYVADVAEQFHLRRMTNVNDEALRRTDVLAPEEFWLKGGGSETQCWIIKPPGFRANRKYPAILEIHGGPQAQYGQSFFHEMQVLAGRGYVVVYCNPRGSAGYGRDFRRSIIGDWGSVDYKDVRKVSDWIFSRPFVDRKRVGVTGGSYGGFMTNWIVGHETRFRAAVTQRSCVNFESFFGTSDLGHVIAGELMGLPWKNHERLRRQSPFTYVDKIRTPLLIIHSEQDLRCPLEQAEQLFVALKYLGREVEYVAFEGESHGLSRGGRPQNRAERLRRIVGWFDRYMR